MQGLCDNAAVCVEGEEGGLIGEDVAAHFLCHYKACAHAGIGGNVPIGVVCKGLSLGGDAKGLGPEGDLLGVGAGSIAAGDEGVLAVGNGCTSLHVSAIQHMRPVVTE